MAKRPFTGFIGVTWGGYNQPGATFEQACREAYGTCDLHGPEWDRSRSDDCGCQPHEIILQDLYGEVVKAWIPRRSFHQVDGWSSSLAGLFVTDKSGVVTK